MFAPVTQRVPRLDAAGNPVYDADGKPVTETRMVGVKPAAVFDVSQTDGVPLPQQPEVELLEGGSADRPLCVAGGLLRVQGLHGLTR